MFYQLPPAGNPLCLHGRPSAEDALPGFFSPYTPRFYNSGTAALAAAIQVAMRLKTTDAPEVILPAYGCPDLVSATVYTGARPVLVDLEDDRPWMNLDQLASHVNSHTVAIVAVNLLGIPERREALRGIATQHSALLIEDSAQAFPARREASFWLGDLVVLSFGRGKPVSLLGGGAVLYRDPALGQQLPVVDDPSAGKSHEPTAFRLKAMLYNGMISPYLYWIPQALPFLHLGETRYHSLDSIKAMDLTRRGLLQKNIIRYQRHKLEMQDALATMIAELAAAGKGILDLPALCRVPKHHRLLRYPVLLEPEWRDRCYRQLRREGLGASLMYPATLPAIPGVGEFVDSDNKFLMAATRFSERILTLPTHGRLRSRDIAKIRRILSP